MSAPFDTSLRSPIAVVREFYARGQDAVVAVGGMTDTQGQAYITSELDDRVTELLTSPSPPTLWLITGSAGFGKSALISSLEDSHPDAFEEVVQDATHADSPSETQADALVRFFEPFANGSVPPASPRIIAANTGMVIQFFHQLRGRGEAQFSALESVINYRLGLTDKEPPDVPWSMVVLNLDLRPTAGPGGLMAGVLERMDFSNEDGILGPEPRCETCQVRDFCPVRSNSLLARASTEAIDRLAEQATLERARHSGPRQLYDLAARLLTGNDAFDADEDPCFAVARAAERDDTAWVWEHLLPAKLSSLDGELGERIASLDPSLAPSSHAHDLLATAGLRPARDADRVASLDPGGAEAFAHAARYIGGGLPNSAARGALGRALVAADFLVRPDHWDIGDRTAVEFRQILDTYGRLSRGERQETDTVELGRLMGLVEQALARTFGVVDGPKAYLPVHSYDPRDPSRIFVAGDLSFGADSFNVVPDPPQVRDPQGAQLAGHRPLAVVATLGGVELAITLPVFRLIREAAEKTLASTSDLERFYALRHAVEALARRAGEGASELMIERPGTDRHYIVRKVPGPLGGQETYSVVETAR